MTTPQLSARRTMTRRQLLVLGATTAFSVAFLRAGGPASTVTHDTPPVTRFQRPEHLALGYTSGSTVNAESLVIDASSLPDGSARLAGEGARFRIHGLNPTTDTSALALVEWLTIDVSYVPYHDTPFQAWTFVNGTVPRVSSPLAITVPIEESTGLQLLVAYKLAGASGPVQSTVQFSTGAQRGAPKLAEGTYLIGLPDANNVLPDWNQHHLLVESTSGSSRQHNILHLYEESSGVNIPARRPHVLLSIA